MPSPIPDASAAPVRGDAATAHATPNAALLETALQSPDAASGAAPNTVIEDALRGDRYVPLDKLGAGGMGTVYAAYDRELDRKVAVKVIRAEYGNDRELRERMKREAQAMARLSHPNIAQIYDVGEVAATAYIAMEFIDGVTLERWLETPRAWRETLEVLVQVGRGLAAAHAEGLVHRDIKPQNILIDGDGRPRVIDFGLARGGTGAPEPTPSSRPAVEPRDSGLLNTPITRADAILGTPAYMAPEQFAGAPADAAADQFGFCVALYEALYGHPPFDRGSLARLLDALENGEVRPPPDDTEVPTWLHEHIVRGLAPAPADRWPSMDALVEQLAQDPETNLRTGERARFIVGTTCLVLTIASWVAAVWLFERELLSAELVGVVAMIPNVLLIGAVIWLMRAEIRKSAINRGVAAWTVVLCVAILANRVLGLLMGSPFAVTGTHDLVILASVSALAVFTIARWAVWMTVNFGAAAIITALVPALAPTMLGVSLCAGVALGAFFTMQGARAKRTS